MGKNSNLTVILMITTFICCTVNNFSYAIIIPFIMNFEDSQKLAFFLRIAIISFTITPLTCIVVYFLYKPLEKTNKILNEGKTPSNGEYFNARRSLNNIIKFVIIIGVSAYMLGFILNIGVEIIQNKGIIAYDNVIMRFITSFIWGVIGGFITGRIYNIIFMETRIRLNIININDKIKGEHFEETKYRLLIPSALILLFLSSFCGILLYSYTKDINPILRTEMLNSFFSNNILIKPEREIMSIINSIIINNEKYISNNIFTSFIIISFLFLIGIALIVIVILEHQSHINNLRKQIVRISEGDKDYTKRIYIISFDDIGFMTGEFNNIFNNLSKTFKNFRAHSNSVFDSSIITKNTIAELEDRANEMTVLLKDALDNSVTQSDTLYKSIEIINMMLDNVDGSITKINEQSSKVTETSASIKDMITSFANVNKSLMTTEEYYHKLSKSIENGISQIEYSIKSTNTINETSNKVAEIVKFISDISEQSNVLALNATIEAAHAGDSGKGFAIVAREMKVLSERTSKSTKDIELLVNELKKNNSKGLEISEILNNVFIELKNGMNNTGKNISDIALTSKILSDTAMKNLIYIDDLVNITKAVMKDSLTLMKDKESIADSNFKIDSIAKKVLDINRKLSEGMQFVSSSIGKMNHYFEDSFHSINKLKDSITEYKLD